MASKTRLIVKNLPKHLTDERFRKHFASQGAEITDARVVHTKEGASRQFGFIGLRTEADARAVAAYFNNTYLDTSRITVELARPVGDRSGAWSRHTPGTSAFNARQPPPGPAPALASTAPSEKPASKAEEALARLAPRTATSRPYWANDDPDVKVRHKDGKRIETQLVPSKRVGAAEVLEKREHVVFEDEADEASSEAETRVADDKAVNGNNENDNQNGQAEEHAANEALSDLDYLRSKMSSTFEEELQEDGADEQDGKEQVDEQEGQGEAQKPKKTGKGQAKEAAEEEEEEEDVGESGRLLLRNLPFTVTEAELLRHVQRFGPVAELRLPLDPSTRRPRGIAFVLYMLPQDAVKALEELDGSPFLGRLLHALPARAAPSAASTTRAAADEKDGRRKRTTVQVEQEKKHRSMSANESAWNALFMRPDSVATAAARTLGVEKAALLTEGASPALQLALAETSMVADTRAFLASQGVQLDVLRAAVSGTSVSRSECVLLVKNLPPETDEAQLREHFEKHGPLSRFVLPPSRLIALLEFAHPPDARAAFRALNYARFQHVPLFLEWAPVALFTGPPPTTTTTTDPSPAPVAPPSKAGKRKAAQEAANAVSEATEAKADEEHADAHCTSVFVKNLSFSSTEPDLRAHAAALGVEARKVSVAMKREASTGKQLSMGFGFVECASRDAATAAVRLLHGSQLAGHTLIAKLSLRGENSAASSAAKKRRESSETKTSRKLLVKNLAFEATGKELRALFEPFGNVQRVRVPRKADGAHRGFAFVELATKQEARNALAALGATHLYGRRLVLEYAKSDEMRDETASLVDHSSDFIPLQ